MPPSLKSTQINARWVTTMIFQSDPNIIRWRLHLNSPIAQVYQALATDAGRASFWAESAIERDRLIHFVFPNGITWEAQVLEAHLPER